MQQKAYRNGIFGHVLYNITAILHYYYLQCIKTANVTENSIQTLIVCSFRTRMRTSKTQQSNKPISYSIQRDVIIIYTSSRGENKQNYRSIGFRAGNLVWKSNEPCGSVRKPFQGGHYHIIGDIIRRKIKRMVGQRKANPSVHDSIGTGDIVRGSCARIFTSLFGVDCRWIERESHLNFN